MTDKKQEWETITVIYTGKQKTKEGERKNEAGEEVTWKMYKVMFKLKEDEKFDKKAIIFSGTDGIDLLNEDNEGKLLTFKCVVEGYENSYGRQISKKITNVTKPEENATVSDHVMTRDDFYGETKEKGVNESVQTPVYNIKLPTNSELEQIHKQYVQSADKSVQSLNHFIGTVLFSMNIDKLSYIKDMYENTK